MLEFCVGVMALASCALNFPAMALYQRYEEQGRLSFDSFALSFLKMINRLACKASWCCGKSAVVGIIGLLWIITYLYHYLITLILADAIMINFANVITTILTSISFCRIQYQVIDDFSGWCRSPRTNLLDVVSGCWEIILAGTVLMHLTLNMLNL